jgi:D-inositol-3-phosphate glycosyltransferase
VDLVVVGGPSGSAGHRASVDRLTGLARSLGIADRVRFLAPRSQDGLADLYAAAEVVLVPSRSESFGLVALEAQASGAPVVAADAGGLRYVVLDGITGFVVPGHDPVAHADRVATLLAHPARARAMGRAGVVHATEFSWDATAERVLQVYREVLGSAGDGVDGSGNGRADHPDGPSPHVEAASAGT